MKKVAAILFCLFLIVICPITVFAQTVNGEGDRTAVITTAVPKYHKITISAEGAKVELNGKNGIEFVVDRLSEPTIHINVDSEKEIKQVLINDEDITDKMVDNSYTIESVYEDKLITVIVQSSTEPSTPDTPHTGDTPCTVLYIIMVLAFGIFLISHRKLLQKGKL